MGTVNERRPTSPVAARTGTVVDEFNYGARTSDSRALAVDAADSEVTPVPLPASELDPAARTRMASLRAAMFGVTSAPARVDRFILLETLGAGGMGVVYAAYDPRLDRKIALKLVKPDLAASATSVDSRLLREAQAMARLSHPNVVQIHEVGAWEGRLYIAMELVAGRSLATWLSGQARPWRAVVRVFVEAGRGLAAAHAAGIVHRDFKPENVLVGDDGRVRVTDFGLARGGPREGDVAVPGADDPLGALAGVAATATGELAGTPAYMAPEQFLGETATPATDLFSYCVALYQALHGIRPFAGEDRGALARAVLAGSLREPPRLRIPRRLHRALVRGLARAPAARFPTMDALLAVIEPRSRWRTIGPAAAVALVLSAALGVLFAPDPCEDTSRLLTGVWDDAQQAATRDAFMAADVPDAETLWSTTARELDAYTGAVAHAYSESCRAQRRGEASWQLHDVRVDCLRRRLAVARGIALAVDAGDPETLRNAPRAAAGLAELGVCEDGLALARGLDPLPLAQMGAVARAQADLARARALELLGDMDSSRALAERALAAARARGHAPTSAEAAYQLGRLLVLAREFQAAEAALREAFALAVASRHDAVVGEILSWKIQARVIGRGEARDVDELLQQLESWLRRSPPSPLQTAELERTRSVVHEARGEFAAAEASRRRALELRTREFGRDHLAVAIDRMLHANLLDRLGRTDEALEMYTEALTVMRARVGEAHSLVYDGRYNFGVALLNVGEAAAIAEAEAQFLAAREGLERQLGARALELASVDLALARVAQIRGDLAGAEERVARALEIFEHHPQHPDEALVHLFRGALHHARGRMDESLAAHRRAREIAAAAWGPTNYVVGVADGNIADVLREQGDLAGAERRYASALGPIEAALDAEAPELIGPLLGLGLSRAEQGHACEALAPLDRALALLAEHDAEPDAIAEAAAARARADERCEIGRAG